MKIKFLGATGEVTGSCIWCIADSGAEFLVDCGAYQGWNAVRKNHRMFPFNAENIQFVLLTHAHIDHCGRIPLLYKRGFKGAVYCTAATADLTRLNLLDAAKIEAGRCANSDGAAPLFDNTDVDRVQFSPIDEHKDGFRNPAPVGVENNFWVNFTRSSHMLGAASVTVSWESGGGMKKIFFSGDVGNNREGGSYQALLKRNQIAHKDVDYVVLESTYGGRPAREAEFKDAVKRIEAIKEIVCNPAYTAVIFPCFAMQRTQEVLFDLFCALEYCNPGDPTKYRIVTDSLMAKKASRVFYEHLTKRNPEDPKKGIYLNGHCTAALAEHYNVDIDPLGIAGRIFDKAGCETDKLSINGMFSKQFKDDGFDSLDQQEKVIIITSSGMCHEGPVRGHIPLLRDPRTALVLTGYQSTDNGQLLQKLAAGDVIEESDAALETSEDEPLFVKDIQGKVFNMGAYYSGHADSDNLLKFLFERSGDKGHASSPKQVVVLLNHGDNAARSAFKKLIEERSRRGVETDMRSVGEVVLTAVDSPFYDLNKGTWADEFFEILQNQRQIMGKLESLMAQLEMSKAKKKGKKKGDKKPD